MGCSYQDPPSLSQERIQVYPPPDPSQPQLLTLLQVRLLKKLGRNAYPFTFSVRNDCVMFLSPPPLLYSPSLPPSIPPLPPPSYLPPSSAQASLPLCLFNRVKERRTNRVELISSSDAL